MKRLSLKLACIFFILCFSLVPLCAADLNQTDNNIADTNMLNAVDPNLKMHTNPYYEDGVDIELTADKDFKGYVDLNITTWDAVPYRHYVLYVNNGYGFLHVSGLEKGNYVIQATFDGDEQFNPCGSRACIRIS